MTQTKPARGGARQNTGLVQRLELSKGDARYLRIVLLSRYGNAKKETANAFIAGLIREQWAAYIVNQS